jgi:hypothetical protein
LEGKHFSFWVGMWGHTRHEIGTWFTWFFFFFNSQSSQRCRTRQGKDQRYPCRQYWVRIELIRVVVQLASNHDQFSIQSEFRIK